MLTVSDPAAALGVPGQMSPAQCADAEARRSEARERYDERAPEATESAVVDINDRYPFWPQGYKTLVDLYLLHHRWTDAEYAQRQLLAIAPSYQRAAMLAELLGRQDRLEESEALFVELWHQRSSMDREDAGYVAHGLLVTLTRLQRPDRMLAVADEAVSQLGPVPALVYQRALALMLLGRRDEARAECDRVLRELPQTEPLYPKLLQMRRMLGGGTTGG